MERDAKVWKLWCRMDKITRWLGGDRWEMLWQKWNEVIFRNYGKPGANQ